MVSPLHTLACTSCNSNSLGLGGRVKALTPKEPYVCPETADIFQCVSASNLGKITVLRIILTGWRTMLQTRKK